MSDHQDELMEQYLYAAQITNTIRLMRFFLLSILILCFYIYFIFHYSFNFSTFAFNAWFLLSELGLAGCLFFNEMRFKPGQYSIQMAHRWIKLVCLLVGISLGIGIALLYYFLPKYSLEMSTYQAIILAALLVIISQTFALTFLTQRLSYFCWVFIPVITPYIAAQFLIRSETSAFFFQCDKNKYHFHEIE